MFKATINLYKQAYTGLNRRMWLLAVVMLINRSGTMVLPFMTLYCSHIGYSIEQAGLVVAIYGLGSLAGAFLGGQISDRLGFYNTQLAALFCGGVLFITLGQMDTLLSISICTFFLSMVNESFRPANSSAIAHYSTAKNRTQAFSIVRLAINLGWGVGGALGGLLASINYHLLFWVDGLTNISAAAMLFALLPKVTLAEQKNITNPGHVTTKALPAHRDKPFIYFIMLQVLFAFCFFQLFTTMPIFYKDVLHINESGIGLLMAMNGIFIVLFEMVMVFKLEGRRSYLRLISIGTVIMGIAFIILNIPLIHGFLLAVISMLLISFGEMVAMPFMNSYYISRSAEGNRGQYAALYTMAWSAAQVLGSTVGTQIAYRAGFNNLWWTIGGICVLAAAGYHYLNFKN